jgi:butyrate kinase
VIVLGSQHIQGRIREREREVKYQTVATAYPQVLQTVGECSTCTSGVVVLVALDFGLARTPFALAISCTACFPGFTMPLVLFMAISGDGCVQR